jgi:hypothetical protein
MVSHSGVERAGETGDGVVGSLMYRRIAQA